MTVFKDNFSKQSVTYRRYRPAYPAELFEYLSSLTGQHELAWDCGTGNGQAAISLAAYYKSIYATDPSGQQIQNAQACDNVVYKVEKAESVSLGKHSADLVTIAQALHWFDFDLFYSEVKRVLKPGGLIAAWAYGLPAVCKDTDAIIRHFHDDTVGAFWQKENRLIEKGYSTIPFPFHELKNPGFSIQKQVNLNDLLGLVSSWSAVQKYKDRIGADPIIKLEAALKPFWTEGEVRQATWELILRTGRV